MTDKPRQTNNDPGSTIDAKIADLLDQYLSEREQGRAVERHQWLREHPEYAERLAECLDAAALFGGAETGGFDLPAEPGLPDSIGDFEILGELGRGGMGVVYEAREKSLDRIVALKVMRFGIVDSKALERFRREAETAGALHHTNIVPVYATGREGDTSWYAMQRIEGESLAVRLDHARQNRTPPQLEEILDVGIQAADALDHAHERHVVHRDVKPANLILDHEDRVWLTDFGLARRLVDAGATVTGAILGTPRYMSPEQADLRTTDVDHRSDIYSLAATLYEMATVRPPFEGDDPLQLITRIRYEEPPGVRTFRPELPRDFEVVLQKAMQKDVARRYQSAATFADDLRAIRDDHPIQARPLSILEKTARLGRKHQSRVRVAAAAMVVTAVLIAALLSGLDQWRQSRLGAFRIRAGGGPYQATIFPAGGSAFSDTAVALTLPMQNQQQKIAGDYDMLVAPQGRWSQTLRLPVTTGMPSEYRITNQSIESQDISINDASVVTVSDQMTPAILWRRDGLLKRISWDKDQQWELDVSEIECVVTAIGDSDVATTETIPVNFANTKQPVNFDSGHHFIEDDPLLTQGAAAVRTRIDLDGDQRADTLIAATDQQSLLAIGNQGNVLWSRSYVFAGLPRKTQLPDPFSRKGMLPFPGVFDLQDVGDLNDDGIHDVFAMFAHYQATGQTEVCLATLSGKTGVALQSNHQAYQTTQNVFWPADGLFSAMKHQYRAFSGLSFSSDSAYRSGHRSFYDFQVRYQPFSTPIRIPVPSPPQLLREDDTLRVVQLTGDQCQIIDWNHEDQAAISIKLPFVPAHAPRVARWRGETLLVFHDHKETQSKTARFSGTEIVTYDLSGQQRWSRQLELIEWQKSIDRNHADWPYVADLNGDGDNELIVPRNRYLNGVDLGVQLLDVATGEPVWDQATPYSALQSADDCLSRITVTDDIDGDGWDDIATATIAGRGSRRGTGNAVDREAYVYIDWISGKTGTVIAWARHQIPVFGDQIRVTQVDAIRSRLPGAPTGTVEIDFVTGDRTLDVMLASAVVRFDPSQPGPVAIAAGLDVCQSATDSTSSLRVYRRRGGPFGVGEDHLVLLPSEPSKTIRLGETSLLAAWETDSGQSLVAASGFQPTRISVIDAATDQTVWSSDRTEGDGVSWIPIRRHDGSVDFLAQRQSGDETPPLLVDGETGAEISPVQDIVGGRVILSHAIDDGKSVLLVGDGQLANRSQRTIGGQPINAFRMSLVSLATGEIRWAHHYLFGASRNNSPQGYDHLQFADVNGDGVQDIVGPDSHDEELFLTAWDGATGDKLWERPVHQKPTRTNYWIPFSLLEVNDQTHVVYLGRSSLESTQQDLVLCGPDGEIVSSQSLGPELRIPVVDGSFSYRHVVIGDATTAEGHPLFAISYALNGKYQCLVYTLSDNPFRIHRQFTQSDENAFMAGMWFRDLDGDDVNERVVINRVDSDSRSTLVAKCYSMLETEPRFQITIPDASGLQRVDWKSDHDVQISWLRIDQDRIVAIDWSNRRLLAETSGDVDVPSNLPLVCRNEGDQSRIAIPILDGIEFRNIRSETIPESKITEWHSYDDPRRMRPLFASIGGDVTLTEWILQLIRGGIVLTVLVVLPLWYARRTLEARRWSLSWMLLLPALVGIWMVIWQSQWLREPDLVFNLLNGVTAWMCGAALLFAIRDSKDSQGYSIRLMLTVGTPFVFLTFAFFSYVQRADPMTLRYTYDFVGLVRIALLSFTLVVQIYWILRIVASVLGWLRGLTGRQPAT